MSRRKLKFDLRKNYARKKSKGSVTRINPVTELHISLPLSIFTSSPAPDIPSLHRRLMKASIVPSNWICSLIPPDQNLALYKLHVQPHSSSADFSIILTISNNHSWAVRVGQKEVDISQSLLLQGSPSFLKSIGEIVSVLSLLDGSKFCVGNQDEKFKYLDHSHKGKFMDQQGKHCVFIVYKTFSFELYR